jgi:hypothetical protein
LDQLLRRANRLGFSTKARIHIESTGPNALDEAESLSRYGDVRMDQPIDKANREDHQKQNDHELCHD